MSVTQQVMISASVAILLTLGDLVHFSGLSLQILNKSSIANKKIFFLMVLLSYLPKQMEMITLKKSASRLNSMTVLGRMSPVPSSETAVNGNIEFNWLQ